MGTWVNRSTGLDQPQNRWWLASSMDENRVVAVYQPLGAATVAASYVNLNGADEFDASPVVAPVFATVTGWTFNNSEHLTTNITGTGLQSIMVRWTWDGVSGTRASMIGYDSGIREHWMEAEQVIATIFQPRGYNSSSATSVSGEIDIVSCMSRNSYYLNGVFVANVGALDTWNEGTITIANNIVAGSIKFTGDIAAIAIYSDQLSAGEVSEITTNLAAITSSDDPVTDPFPVNWIVQNPATKRLNSTSHELWIATDGGIFRTLDGGRGWAQVVLPDPSNAEFVDSPAATVDELTFHWIDYDPTDELTLLALAAKNSTSRMWEYKTTDLGLTWASRGVITT